MDGPVITFQYEGKHMRVPAAFIHEWVNVERPLFKGINSYFLRITYIQPFIDNYITEEDYGVRLR